MIMDNKKVSLPQLPLNANLIRNASVENFSNPHLPIE